MFSFVRRRFTAGNCKTYKSELEKFGVHVGKFVIPTLAFVMLSWQHRWSRRWHKIFTIGLCVDLLVENTTKKLKTMLQYKIVFAEQHWKMLTMLLLCHKKVFHKSESIRVKLTCMPAAAFNSAYPLVTAVHSNIKVKKSS